MYKWLLNYHPENYHPNYYWPEMESITPVDGGGSRIQRRRRYDNMELERQREEEELILMMTAWLA